MTGFENQKIMSQVKMSKKNVKCYVSMIPHINNIIDKPAPKLEFQRKSVQSGGLDKSYEKLPRR